MKIVIWWVWAGGKKTPPWALSEYMAVTPPQVSFLLKEVQPAKRRATFFEMLVFWGFEKNSFDGLINFSGGSGCLLSLLLKRIILRVSF